MPINLKKVRIPHVFIFLSSIILFCSILTYLVPSGIYKRKNILIGQLEQTIIIPGSYERLEKHYSVKGLILGDKRDGKATPVSILGLFTSIPRGMNQAASLIFFVFIVGAVFSVIQTTGTINVIMYYLLEKYRKKPLMLYLGIFTLIFFAGSFMGMHAEFIPLIPLFLLISKETGRDRVFGLSLLLVASYTGWTAALTNPFNLQIAQKVAEVPIGSGMGLRILLFVVCWAISFTYVMVYGNKVKNNKAKSVMQDDPFELDEFDHLEKRRIEKKHILIITVALVLFSMILYAVQTMGWGLIEMSGGFFMVGLATILISGMPGSEAMKAFTKGLEFMIVPALIVGFARGIQVVLVEGQIVDTMLHYTAQSLEKLPTLMAAEGMLFFQTMLNFFIPSASGQALVSMPLMVPLSDLLSISRQSAVLAFILGDGFSNLVVPTNGELMATIGIAGIPFEKWIKFILPLFLILMVVAIVMLMIAILIGYQ